jgi:hypothetical protein
VQTIPGDIIQELSERGFTISCSAMLILRFMSVMYLLLGLGASTMRRPVLRLFAGASEDSLASVLFPLFALHEALHGVSPYDLQVL